MGGAIRHIAMVSIQEYFCHIFSFDLNCRTFSSCPRMHREGALLGNQEGTSVEGRPPPVVSHQVTVTPAGLGAEFQKAAALPHVEKATTLSKYVFFPL